MHKINVLPEHMATTCKPMFSLSRKSLGKFNIDTERGQIDLPL